ncbi:MAG: ABC transporter substrate-binding protein [Clostridia bacterium]|nr:ABC transporter substrate-binding protein [Clostridia bacterium]
MRKTALMLALCLLLGGCATSPATTLPHTVENPPASEPLTAPSTKERSFTMAYMAEDTLNPYLCASKLTRDMLSLVYWPIVSIGESFRAVPQIAEEVSSSDGGLTWQIRVRQDLFFSDGTALKAKHVTDSLNYVRKTSKSLYFEQTADIQSVKSGDYTVTVTLETANPYFDLLLDIPVTSKPSTKENLVGCGAYRLLRGEEDSISLQANPYFPETIGVTEILLAAVSDGDGAVLSFSNGVLDLYYAEDYHGELFSHKHDYEIREFDTSRLTFLSVQTLSKKNPCLQDEKVRRALSAFIDRSELVRKACSSLAVEAQGLIHSNHPLASLLSETEQAADLLENCLAEYGYTKRDEEGYLVNRKGARITLVLLTNRENDRRRAIGQQLVERLEQAGIQVQWNEYGWHRFSSELKEGNYDLVLLETKLRADMDLTAFFAGGSLCAYGYETEAPLSVAEAWGILNTQMPVIPLVYGRAAVFNTRKLHLAMSSFYEHPYARFHLNTWRGEDNA